MEKLKNKKNNLLIIILYIGLIISVTNCSQTDSKQINTKTFEEECTIGVASGKATEDGRPLLWKTRDYKSDYNILFYTETNRYNFISNITTSYGFNKSWMGVNEKGFAILNSLSSDLKKSENGPGNGDFMHIALAFCSTVAEFQDLLDRTNISGRTTNANFGVIDSTGAAMIFETAGKEYWKFDANDSDQSPEGYVLRTNFSFNGGGKGGLQRFERTNKLIKDFYSGDSLNYKSIIRYQMRDLVDRDNQKIAIPWEGRWGESPVGYIHCTNSISRPTSIGAAVFHGVKEGELARLTTMWTIIGQPAASIATPYWPIGKASKLSSHEKRSGLFNITAKIKNQLFDYRNKNFINTNKLRNNNGTGLWNYTFKVEDEIFAVTKECIQNWRLIGSTKKDMIKLENRLAKLAYKGLKKGSRKIK